MYPAEFLENVVSNSKFLTGAIFSFSPEKCVQFFEDGGLKLKLERGGRYFPVSDKASDVYTLSGNYCKDVGVTFKFGEKVEKIDILYSTMSHIITANGEFNFDNVIVCTGGLSYPSTGSTGDGYEFRKNGGA